MRPPNSSATGSDLAPHRTDPKLLAALMRQHRRRFAPARHHRPTPQLRKRPPHQNRLASSARAQTPASSPMPKPPSVAPSPLLGVSGSRRVNCFTATCPRQTTADAGMHSTRLGFPASASSCRTGQGHCVLTPPVASSARTPDLQRWNPGACAATGQEAEDRQAGAPGSRIAQSRPAPTGLVSGARGDRTAAGTERATACPSSSGSSPLQGR